MLQVLGIAVSSGSFFATPPRPDYHGKHTWVRLTARRPRSAMCRDTKTGACRFFFPLPQGLANACQLSIVFSMAHVGVGLFSAWSTSLLRGSHSMMQHADLGGPSRAIAAIGGSCEDRGHRGSGRGRRMRSLYVTLCDRGRAQVGGARRGWRERGS